MKYPKTTLQEILLYLINYGSVSIMDFPYLSSFRTRISDLKLKHDLSLKTIQKQEVNKFGNSYTYACHILEEKEKENAIKLYKQLTK